MPVLEPCRVELVAQGTGESAFAGFDDGAGVVGDQPAQHGVGVPGVAQVPGAVELMQAGGGEAEGVADVMQPGGGFERIGVRAQNECQAASPGSDTLHRVPSGGAGAPGGMPGRAGQPMMPALSQGGEIHGAAMTGPEHSRRARGSCR